MIKGIGNIRSNAFLRYMGISAFNIKHYFVIVIVKINSWSSEPKTLSLSLSII